MAVATWHKEMNPSNIPSFSGKKNTRLCDSSPLWSLVVEITQWTADFCRTRCSFLSPYGSYQGFHWIKSADPVYYIICNVGRFGSLAVELVAKSGDPLSDQLLMPAPCEASYDRLRNHGLVLHRTYVNGSYQSRSSSNAYTNSFTKTSAI